MGGNAFPGLPVTRINRADIQATLLYVVNTLNYPELTIKYISDHLMGSAGKQHTSGDLDIAINNRKLVFIGQPNLPVFSLKDLSEKCQRVLPIGQVNTKTLKGGQIQTAWPIRGNPINGLVQVDFIAGHPEWLLFSHYSPGLDISPWKGVMISTMLGVLAKMRKDFEAFNDQQERIARIGLHYDLELGLYRKWELQLKPGHGLSNVSPETFETKLSNSPRFSRIGYVDSPIAVLEMLFGTTVYPHEVNTFEKLISRIKQVYPKTFPSIKDRFLFAFTKTSGARDYSIDEVMHSNVWD